MDFNKSCDNNNNKGVYLWFGVVAAGGSKSRVRYTRYICAYIDTDIICIYIYIGWYTHKWAWTKPPGARTIPRVYEERNRDGDLWEGESFCKHRARHFPRATNFRNSIPFIFPRRTSVAFPRKLSNNPKQVPIVTRRVYTRRWGALFIITTCTPVLYIYVEIFLLCFKFRRRVQDDTEILVCMWEVADDLCFHRNKNKKKDANEVCWSRILQRIISTSNACFLIVLFYFIHFARTNAAVDFKRGITLRY